MFVGVTVFAVWLGWEVKFVRDRKAFLDSEHCPPYSLGPQAMVPIWRRALGDMAIKSFRLSHYNTDHDRQRTLAKSLFPEAEIVRN